MAKTMKWPPVPVNGRIPFVKGEEATRILVMTTLSDLTAQPFNSDGLSLGDVTFRVQSVGRAAITAALSRLDRIISVEAIDEKFTEDGSAEYTILYSDRETQVRSEVVVNG